MSVHVSSTSAHRQEVKIALYSLWYHHTYRWPSGARDIVRFIEMHGQQNINQKKKVTDDNIIRSMRIAYRITKVTDTQSECVILIAFPRQ